MKVLFNLVSHSSTSVLPEALLSIKLSILYCLNQSESNSIIDLHVLVTENGSCSLAVINQYLDFYLHGLCTYSSHCIPNKGYNNAINHGISFARSFGYDYLVCGNPDIKISSDYLAYLYDISTNFYVAVPQVFNLPSLLPQNPRRFKQAFIRTILMDFYYSSYLVFFALSLLKNLYISLFSFGSRQSSSLGEEPSLPTPIKLACGVQFIFNISRLPPNFFLDEFIFLWGEEMSLAYKLRLLNTSFILFECLKVYHSVSSSVSRLSSFRYYQIQRRSYYHIRSLYFLL